MSRSKSSLVFALAWLLTTVAATTATAETPLPNGLAIELLPDYTHQPLQGIDSIVGKFAKKDGLTISYEIGGVVPPGGPRFGGSYLDYAQRMPADERQWFKEHKVGGRKVSVAYGKNQQLIVSTQFDKVGINFHTTAKTPEEVADVLLMTLTIAEKPQKK